MSFFISHHVRFLEAELVRVREEHREEIKTLREQHQAELQYARSEHARLVEEIDYLRRYAASGMNVLRPAKVSGNAASPEGMDALAKAVSEIPMGTPWQRILQRTMKERETERENKKQPTPPGNGQIFEAAQAKEN